MPTARRVSIPFIAGQWSLPERIVAPRRRRQVSIPFIAGQWSLPRHRNAVGSGSSRRFNPLHCGAVVASRCVEVPLGSADRFQSPSLRGSGRFSRRDGPGALRPVHVSIPFIAGQWSLHAPKVRLVWGFPFEFQSPSLRGSGRFARGDGPPAVGRGEFQSPSLRGSGRFLSARGMPRRWCSACFNPLHCGAVVASLPRTTPSSLFGVLLRKRRLPCDHIICTRLPF